MNSMSRRASLALLGGAPLAALASARAASPDIPAAASSRETIRKRHFPNVPLVTQEGRKVNFYDDLIKDKIVVLNMMYADCAGICPGVTMNLAKLQRALGARAGRDVFFVSITLKPAHDTPAVLARYATVHGAGPGWLFVTGAAKDIEDLRRRLGFVDPDPALDRDVNQHIGNVRFGNEALQLWASCPGLVDPQRMVEVIASVDWPTGGRPQGERP